MFGLIKLILTILLINVEPFTCLSDEPVTGPTNAFGPSDIDPGTFLSELLISNSAPGCPGICIHAITTLLCEDVLDDIPCPSSLFKCCILPNNTNYGTMVETSPPQIEEITTLAPVDSSSYEKHISSPASLLPPVSSSQSVPSPVDQPPNQSRNQPAPTTLKTSPALVSTTQPSSTKFTGLMQRVPLKCAGDCMEARLSKYCGKILTNSDMCDSDQICCLEAAKEPASSSSPSEPITELADLSSSSSSTISESTTVANSVSSDSLNSVSSSVLNTISSVVSNILSGGVSNDATDSTGSEATKNQTTGSSEKKIVLEEESLKNETADAENNTASIKQGNNKNLENPQDLPACSECVTMLFGLLCDGIDHGKYCPNGNVCCVYNNSDTIEQPMSNSQQQSSTNNEIGSCPGRCLPKFLHGICPKTSKILFKTTNCLAGMICCYDPSKDLNGDLHFNSSDANEKPSLLNSNSDDLKYIEPSESSLSNNPNLNVKFKPPGYFQAVPRPGHLLQPNQFTSLQSTTPTNLLPPAPANWPFLNSLPKIPIYKPLLSNSQMIPNPYLPNGRPGLGHQYLDLNRQPALFYPHSNSPHTGDLFANLNAHLANSHLSNNVLPTIASPTFKLNSTSSLISHLLSINNIPPASCTGSCFPQFFRFTCFGTNTIYPNFVCSKQGHLCCASLSDVETYEATILGGLSNETLNSLLHNSYFGNNFSLASLLTKNNLPGPPNMAGANLASVLPSGLQSNLAGSLVSGLQPMPVNKVNGALNGASIAKNNNKLKNKNQSFAVNKPIQPSIDRITSESNPLITEKLADINQPTSSSANSRNRFSAPPSTAINKSSPKLTPIVNNSKWSSSLSNLSNNQFTPSEKPLNQKPSNNGDKPKKPPVLMPLSPEHFPEVSSVSSKLPVCGMPGDAPSKWCWQVALVNQENQFISSGALIGTSWVLTNAHGISKLVQNAEPIFVRVGEAEVSTSSSDAGLQRVAIAAAYIHHNHNADTLENDIALLKLQKPVQLKPNICLICLPARSSFVQANKRCTATGYGYTSETSLNVREASVPILTDYQCLRKTNLLTNKSFILPTSSFCAGDEENNSEEGCLFDGGSPLACFDEEGYYELSGLVSYGFGCDRGKAGIYGMVKVSMFVGWINQIISVNN